MADKVILVEYNIPAKKMEYYSPNLLKLVMFGH